MSEIRIRMVRPEDLADCLALEQATYPASEAATESSLRKRIARFPEGFYLAHDGDRLVGMVNGGATNSDDISAEEFKALEGHDSAGRNLVIFSLATLPACQKSGIGTLLLAHIKERAREQGRERIMLICKDELIGYYGRRGYEYVAPSASNHGGAAWHTMVMPLA